MLLIDLSLNILGNVIIFLNSSSLVKLRATCRELRVCCLHLIHLLRPSVTFYKYERMPFRLAISEKEKQRFLFNILRNFPYIQSLQIKTYDHISRFASAMHYLYNNETICGTIQHLNISLRGKASLFGISNLTNLQTLNLSYSFDLFGDGMHEVATLLNLTYLDLTRLSGNEHVDNEEGLEWMFLVGLINLETLLLKSCHIPLLGLFSFVNLTKLTTLNLQACTGDALSDAGMEVLTGLLPNIRLLNISFTINVGNAGLRYIGKRLQNLQNLNIHGCTKITNKGVYNLRHATHLKEINIRGIPGISDKILNKIHMVLDVIFIIDDHLLCYN